MTKTSEEALIAILVEKLGGVAVITDYDLRNADGIEITSIYSQASMQTRITASRPAEILEGEIVTAEPQSIEAAPSEAELHGMRAHPGYEYATTEGQRKAWHDVDTPPPGEGWERNTDAGRHGWDRFDYTEESYWRRRRA